MDRKDIIIIILSLIIIALLAIGAYNQAREEQIIYHTVNITDTFSLDVPISDNVTKTQVSPHMHIVNDSQNGIEITSFNMGNESTMDLIGDGSQYLYTQESYKLGAEQINLSNHKLNRSICPIIQYGTIERTTITLHSFLQRRQMTM